MEDDGEIRLTASNGTSVVVQGPMQTAGSAAQRRYVYHAGQSSLSTSHQNVVSWAQGIDALADKSLTITFDDNQNAAPVVSGVSANPDIVNANGTVALSGTATDPDPIPDTLALQWTANPNIGTFSAPTSLDTNWTAPSPADNDREVVFTLTATEPDENLEGSASVNVTVRGNRRPVVTAEADQTTVDVGDVVNLTATATDPEGEPITHAWSSDIGGAFSAPTSLTGTWTAPPVTESIVATLTFTANDGVRNGTRTVTVIVRPPATMPLMLPAIPGKSSVSGVVVNELLPEAQDGLAPYIYSATGLPTGLGFRNRAVRGIPVLPGSYTVTYVVTDSNQDMVTRTFDWVITGDIIPQPSGLNLRIDWGRQFYANAHSDVTGRITSGIDFERGRGTATSILARCQAGQMRCELDNADGLYDEDNPNSPLAGLIRIGLPVQLRDGVTPLWTGVLDSIPTQYERNGQHRANLTALGVLSTAIEPEVSGGSLSAESTAQAFIELCTKGDVPYESPQPMPGDAYIMSRWWEHGGLRETLNHVEDTEGGFIFEDREGELGFHLANYRATRTVARTFVATAPGADQISIAEDPRRELAVKDVKNVVEGSVRQFETKTGETVYASGDPIPIGLGGRLDLVAVYPVTDGAVTELDALSGWTANTAADGSGTNRTGRISITTELMDFNEIHVTIAYATGNNFDNTLYVRGLQVTGAVLAIGTPLRVRVEDTVSIERYRRKTLTLRETWVRSTADMETRAETILEAIASPERRISLDWFVESWADFLALDLSDKVRVEMPTLSSDGFIEAVRCVIPLAAGAPTVCTLDVSLLD